MAYVWLKTEVLCGRLNLAPMVDSQAHGATEHVNLGIADNYAFSRLCNVDCRHTTGVSPQHLRATESCGIEVLSAGCALARTSSFVAQESVAARMIGQGNLDNFEVGIQQGCCTTTHRHHPASIKVPCSFRAVSTTDPVLSPTVHSAILLGALPTVLPGGRLTTSFESITYKYRPVKRQSFKLSEA